MTRTEDTKGRLVRVYEPGDGIRRRFYEALEDSRFTYPSKLAHNHSPEWHCSGAMSARPLYGIYATARLAEHMLAVSKERGVPKLTDAARFFASTRRAMRHILSHYKVTARLPRSGVEHVRGVYMRLCKEGRDLLETTHLTPTTGV